MTQWMPLSSLPSNPPQKNLRRGTSLLEKRGDRSRVMEIDAAAGGDRRFYCWRRSTMRLEIDGGEMIDGEEIRRRRR
ncbi:hypothetical protein L6452_01030 [Arctium lappa]|uniref:Uncharacterized protein n=1 Tax=Arctium lappa TaxID=4217 RepID=A0ACB9FGU5_ARCLA|nr:hypothetical protein L6452_01030 [Arctium lappa]